MRKLLSLALALSCLAPLARAQATTVTVQAMGFSFVPADITINVGDTVEWMYVSGGAHTVTEGTGPAPTGSEAFLAPLESVSPMFSVVFDQAFLDANPRPGDVYDYYCIPHLFAGMTGSVTVIVPDGFDSSCNGDGGDQMGCTDCPCMNNAAPGTVGGCLNSAATSGQMTATGSASLAAGDLRIEANGLVPSSFAVLTSGAAIAPANAVNPCFGLDSGVQSMLLDGLRCAVQNTQRHGGRPVNPLGEVGTTGNAWGPPSGPPGGIGSSAGFASGTTRHFQIFYRELPGTSCLTEQNTTQAISVTFEP